MTRTLLVTLEVEVEIHRSAPLPADDIHPAECEEERWIVGVAGKPIAHKDVPQWLWEAVDRADIDEED